MNAEPHEREDFENEDSVSEVETKSLREKNYDLRMIIKTQESILEIDKRIFMQNKILEGLLNQRTALEEALRVYAK